MTTGEVQGGTVFSNDRYLRALSLLLLLLGWQGLAWAAASPLMPTPVAVALKLWQHIDQGTLLQDVGITLWRVGASFTVAMAVGTAIGIALGRWRRLDQVFDIWIVLGLNIPALVVMILCFIWLGLNEGAAILAVALNKIPLVAVTLREGARTLDDDLVAVARVLGLSEGRALRKVYLPQLYPYLMAAARNGLSLVWKIVLVVELIGRSNGVGFQLGVHFQFFDIASILAYSGAFIVVVLVVEAMVLRPLEASLTRWR